MVTIESLSVTIFYYSGKGQSVVSPSVRPTFNWPTAADLRF